MPKILSTRNQPNAQVSKILAERVRKSKANARLTFLFPISQERRRAVELLGKSEITAEDLAPLFASNDKTVRGAALHCFLKARALDSTFSLASALKQAPIETKQWAAQHVEHALQWGIPAYLKLDDPTRKELQLKPFSSRQLLFSRKPVFAAPHTIQVAKKLNALENISRALASKFGNDFVGLVVVGSIAKGYANKGSDADVYYLHSNKTNAIAKRLVDLAGHAGLKIHAFPSNLTETQLQTSLFRGIFFGNREPLFEAQKKAVESATSQSWENSVGSMQWMERDYLKTITRNDLEPEEIMDLVQAVHLLRTPPSDLEQMRQIMREKEKAIKEGRQTP